MHGFMANQKKNHKENQKQRDKEKINITHIGGQAVMEGVMMRGADCYCIAVRNSSGNIESSLKIAKSAKSVTIIDKIRNISILRGIHRLGISFNIGARVMSASAEMAGLEDTDNNKPPSKFDLWLEKKLGDNLTKFILALSLIIALAFGVFLFMLLPVWLSGFLSGLLAGNLWALGIIEGIIRMAVFMIYIILVSRIKEIQRVFQYHGAEHKTINCYEHNEELNIKNVRKHSRLHPRCGTSFLLFVMIISMAFFLFVRTDILWIRVLSRIIFVPFVAGISYEVIRWAGKSKLAIVRIISAPGMALQKLTTREPDYWQIEVAIRAMEGVLDYESLTFGELRKAGKEILEKSGIKTAALDCDLLLMEACKINRNTLLISENQKPRYRQVRHFWKLVEMRQAGMPYAYIVNKAEFMSLEFYVDENVLIPRPETELLVETVTERETDESYGLEIGTGSGCIAVSLAHYCKAELLAVDISQSALDIAHRNAEFHGVEIQFAQADIFDEVPKTDKKFDFIVSNPPYIPTADIINLDLNVKKYEPTKALDGGADGLDFYRHIAKIAPNRLKIGGRLYLEIGHNQGKDISEILEKEGFDDIEIKKDLAGLDRVVVALLAK